MGFKVILRLSLLADSYFIDYLLSISGSDVLPLSASISC